MTIDEAIKHAEEVAEEKFNNAVSIMDKMKSDIALSNAEECKRCAEDYRQLAEWLKDYKRLKEQEQVLDKIKADIISYEGDCRLSVDEYPSCKQCTDNVFESIYAIIDKYKSESEK